MKTFILNQNTLNQAGFLIKTFMSYKILQGYNICSHIMRQHHAHTRASPTSTLEQPVLCIAIPYFQDIHSQIKPGWNAISSLPHNFHNHLQFSLCWEGFPCSRLRQGMITPASALVLLMPGGKSRAGKRQVGMENLQKGSRG